MSCPGPVLEAAVQKDSYLAEVQRAFFNAPCRDAERRFHNYVMDLLEEAADHDA
ncbi:hypothetical protein ACFVU4_34935 [Streptomyces sp. NPDC058107]|uniref:hypothetical protein n=1 Tax=Streptomyces sp. NPDC058107 TaxID=3346343 RepID=UPI0036E8B14D